MIRSNNNSLNNNKQQLSHRSMILQDLHNNEGRQSIMTARRTAYNKVKSLVSARKFDLINMKDISKEKDIVIQNLNNCQSQEMMDEFEQLSFYQEKYLVLSRFITVLQDKTAKGQKMANDEVNKIVEIFEEQFDPQKQQRPVASNQLFRKPDSLNVNMEPHKQLFSFNAKGNTTANPPKVSTLIPTSTNISQNTGLGAAIFQFFEKKQRETKTTGFKDLIDKRSSVSPSNTSKFKKVKKPMHDLELKKLLQENKRLHDQLEKRAKEDSELNEFEKKVLREQKERCMRRIDELEQEVEDLARNNYKLQEIERSRKAVTTFMNQDSVQSNRSEHQPYYIQTRHNDLKLLTQKNKIVERAGMAEKNNILLNLVNEIPPIEKKQQHSFDDELQQFQERNRMGRSRKQINENNILEGLLEADQEKPRRVGIASDTKLRQNMVSNIKENKNPQKNLFIGGQQIQYVKPSTNDSIENGNRFDSFSVAQTAYNNSSLFMNASKNEIAIDSVTSTRNKVAFFKNSLAIYRDDFIEIAFKRSSLDQTYTQVRFIFYVNNKSDSNEPVRIEYDYETTYYNFKVKQRLIRLQPRQQGREVVEVTLLSGCPDLNSVVDVHFNIGQKRYDLWVPICFIEWTSDTLIEAGQMGFMTIQPDRQFCRYQNLAKILPLSRKVMTSSDESQAFLFGRSKFGNHEVKLTWWQKQLTIDAGHTILDFLGFVMHHFK